MEERYLWKFKWDCGRNGVVEGLFVATVGEILDAVGKHIYLGEVLGKHSEVFGEFEDGDYIQINLDSETIEKVAAVLGDTWSGYNPLHYIGEDSE